MSKTSKNILKYLGNDGELRLPVDEYLEGRRHILPERPEPPPPIRNVERSHAQKKPWRRLMGDEHKYISQFEDEPVPPNRIRQFGSPQEPFQSDRPWRRLTGDEHRYISRFEEQNTRRNRVLDRRINVEMHPPTRPRPPATKMWRQLTGDEHRYISQFEDDYPAFYVARPRRNLLSQTNRLMLILATITFYIIWEKALWLGVFCLFLVPAVMIFKWVKAYLDQQTKS